MEKTIRLSSEDYSNFIRVVSILKEACTDVDIVDGQIRQRANDKHSFFEINLQSIVEDLTISIKGIKQKIDLLKMFNNNGDVEINIDDDYFYFSDQYSSLRFNKIESSYIENNFISKEDFNMNFDINSGELLLTTDIPNTISYRMTTIKPIFDVSCIKVIMKEDEASIEARTDSKDKLAILMSKIPTEMNIDCYVDIPILPFIIDHDSDLNLEIYRFDKDGGDATTVNKVETSIGSAEISIYSKNYID